MANRKRDLELDEALSEAGSFGKFQLMCFALLFPVAIFHGARMTSSAFFLFEEKHRCALPGWSNDTYDVTSEAQQLAYNMSIPPGDKCHIYSLNHTFEYDEFHRPINGNEFLQVCPSGWVYDQSVFHRNALSQLNLVCEHRDDISLASTLLYLGSLVGSAVLGHVSDSYGRKTCLILSVVIHLAFGLAMPWSPNFAAFGAMEFLVGAASTGMFASAFVMGLELVEPKDRKVPGLVIQMFFSVGEILLMGSSYGLRDWRWVELIITLPLVVFLLYYWLVPESPRWLMLKKKYEKASKVLSRIAAINGMPPPRGCDSTEDLERLLQSYDAADGDRGGPSVQVTRGKRDSFFDLFKSCILFQRTCIIFFNWLVVNMIFYGFILNSAHIGSNVFLTFLYGALVEFPAHITTLLLVGRLGRKPVHCTLLLLAALASAGAIGVSLKCDEEHQWIVILLSMIGKYGAAGLMGTSFLWMTELFPTSVRSMGLGVSSSFARAGAMLAPNIVHWAATMSPHNVGKAMPFMVFCAAPLLALLLNLRLPETNHKALPETVEQAIAFGRSQPDFVPATVPAYDVTYGSMDSASYRSDDLIVPTPYGNGKHGATTTGHKTNFNDPCVF